MSRSWKGEADGFAQPRYTRSKFKYIQEELEVDKVFVIINEWDTANGLTSSEVVDNNWYPSESAAWDDLLIIAESCGIGLDVDDTSFTTEDEEYRIEELNRA